MESVRTVIDFVVAVMRDKADRISGGRALWEEMPKGTPLRLLPRGTFLRQPRRGPDVVARFDDGTLALIEVTARLGQRGSPQTPFGPLMRAAASSADELGKPPVLIVVLYGAASVHRVLELQDAGRASFSTSRADDSLLALEHVEVATDRVEDRLIGTAVGETKLSHEVRPPPANRRYISPAEAARELGLSTSSVSISRPPLLPYRARVRPRG